MCRPKSKEAISKLLELVEVCNVGEGFDPIIRIRDSCLSDEEAYELPKRFHDEVPSYKFRKYETKVLSASFCSPEGAELTHFKIGRHDIKPLSSLDKLQSVDPSQTPVYIFYMYTEYRDGLQKGDVISRKFVHGLPGW